MSYILFLVPVVTSLSEITLPQLLPFAIPAAIVAPFITYALAKRSDTVKRKLEYRTFIDMSEIEDNVHLENHHKIPGTKVIMPDNMPPRGELDERGPGGIGYVTYRQRFKFLKIKPFGKSIVTSGSLSIKMIDLKNGKSINYDIMLPILDINEEIFITLYESTGEANNFFLSDIELSYHTQAGEEIMYKRNSDFTRFQELRHTDFHRVQKSFKRSEVLGRNEGSVAKWRHT